MWCAHASGSFLANAIGDDFALHRLDKDRSPPADLHFNGSDLRCSAVSPTNVTRYSSFCWVIAPRSDEADSRS